MRQMALKIADGTPADTDDRAAMSEALNRLYRAASQNASEIVSTLSPSERAKLAVFCYGRVHLNAIGLSIAATCDLEHLVAAANSATQGRTLFQQSRDVTAASSKPTSRRPVVTLATSAGFPRLARVIEQPAELTA